MGLRGICPELGKVNKPVIGMVHLRPLPGSPRFGGDLDAVVAAAVADARALELGGVHGLMIENFGDVPFFGGAVGPETVAAMTVAAVEVGRAVRLPLGINVLRNDGLAALAVALAARAAFVRVNVLAGAVVADQGLIEGRAAELMRFRRAVGAEAISVLADIEVKHASPLVARPLVQEVDELVGRGLADGLIVSGWGTGAPADAQDLANVKAAAGPVPVLVGSGTTPQSVAMLAASADGFIVGSFFKQDGELAMPVDPARVEALVAELL